MATERKVHFYLDEHGNPVVVTPEEGRQLLNQGQEVRYDVPPQSIAEEPEPEDG